MTDSQHATSATPPADATGAASPTRPASPAGPIRQNGSTAIADAAPGAAPAAPGAALGAAAPDSAAPDEALGLRHKPPLCWFDNEAVRPPLQEETRSRVDWARCVPFVLLHVACLAIFLVGFSWVAVGLAVGLYLVRMFAITGFYHRYFSHRTYRTSRAMQFVMALVGASSGQRGPIWWAAHHRHHHNHSDEEVDLHSPEQRGFWKAHMGWFMTPEGFVTPKRLARDWLRFPELRFIDRFDWIAPLALAVGCYGLGAMLERFAPGLGATGWQLFVWGFIVSTVACYHATYTINSLAHTWGSKRFDTDDDSRNNFWLALITLGEGWHNNHHHYPAAARQGFYWWEVDLTYYGLKVMQWVGLIWDLNGVPQRVLDRGRADGA